MTTLRVETFKMNHFLLQIVLINAPESDRIVAALRIVVVDMVVMPGQNVLPVSIKVNMASLWKYL